MACAPGGLQVSKTEKVNFKKDLKLMPMRLAPNIQRYLLPVDELVMSNGLCRYTSFYKSALGVTRGANFRNHLSARK